MLPYVIVLSAVVALVSWAVVYARGFDLLRSHLAVLRSAKRHGGYPLAEKVALDKLFESKAWVVAACALFLSAAVLFGALAVLMFRVLVALMPLLSA